MSRNVKQNKKEINKIGVRYTDGTSDEFEDFLQFNCLKTRLIIELEETIIHVELRNIQNIYYYKK